MSHNIIPPGTSPPPGYKKALLVDGPLAGERSLVKEDATILRIPRPKERNSVLAYSAAPEIILYEEHTYYEWETGSGKFYYSRTQNA